MPYQKRKYQKFLQTLQDLTCTNVSELAQLIGKKQSNVSNYLGPKPPSKRAMQSGLRHLSEWHVIEDQIMLPIDKRTKICTNSGIYFIYDSSGNCVYLGQAKNLKTEVGLRLDSKTLRHGIWRDSKLKLIRYKIKAVAQFVTTYRVDSARLRHNLEALFLRTVINQTQNRKLGEFR